MSLLTSVRWEETQRPKPLSPVAFLLEVLLLFPDLVGCKDLKIVFPEKSVSVTSTWKLEKPLRHACR